MWLKSFLIGQGASAGDSQHDTEVTAESHKKKKNTNNQNIIELSDTDLV